MTMGATSLFHAIHGRQSPRRERETLAVPATLAGMGVLEWLEVHRSDGRDETWHFDSPKPRLAFTRLTRDEYSGTSMLWLVGGSYRVDGTGFHNVRGRGGLERLDAHQARSRFHGTAEKYRRTHGGLRSTEAVRGRVTLTSELVNVGTLVAITYSTDKREGGRSNYRHPFDTSAQPSVMVTADGRQIVLVGGFYTVTDHGIEDAE